MTAGGVVVGLGGIRPARREPETIRWSRFVPATLAEGPGMRAALWVQGCSVRCPGCFNPHLWADRGGRLDATLDLGRRLVADAMAAGSEGVTLLGGEPFDQADAVATIAETFRAEGLTVMTFTGYRLGSLREWSRDRDDLARLLDATDLLIDGPYLRDRPDGIRPWLGSANQGIRALTSAYADEVARIERSGGLDRIEVRIGPDGRVGVNGWAEASALEDLLDGLGERVDRVGERSMR